VETAVVEITVVVETEEEDINIFFNHILKRCQCKLTPFLFPHLRPLQRGGCVRMIIFIQ
jgi:hypothetical protein